MVTWGSINPVGTNWYSSGANECILRIFKHKQSLWVISMCLLKWFNFVWGDKYPRKFGEVGKVLAYIKSLNLWEKVAIFTNFYQ